MLHRKDACDQSIGICKLFISLASASIAFIINLIIDPKIAMPAPVKFAATLLMAASVVAGVIALMHITFRISQGEYDIHAIRYRRCAAWQILTFLAGIFVLGIWALFFI